MTGAMYAAVAGLRTHMSALNVIGNNISNVNTYGYKASRYTFNESLYTTSRSGSNGTDTAGGRNPAQIGYGCSISTIDLDMSTSTYVPTGTGLDCMIDGDGFFIVGDKVPEGVLDQNQLQGMNLTRLGNFEFKDGYLVDGNGQVVYGFLTTGYDTNDEAVINPTLTPIRLPLCTKKLVDGNIVTEVHYPSLTANGNMVDANKAVPADGAGGGAAGGTPGGATGGDDTTAAEEYERVQLDSISIDPSSGVITGTTKDDQTVVVGAIALAKVDSPNGVTHVDGRYYKALGGAGKVHLCSIKGVVQYQYTEPEDGGTGNDTAKVSEITVESAGDTELVTDGLESSGTDLANEISNMIMIQRGYQANTRIVTVTDSMLEELVNMKR